LQPGTACGNLDYPLGLAACKATTTYDTFATSLYTIAEIGYTREAFSLTVKNAGLSGVPFVTPWLWLGGGCHRRVNAHSPGTTACDPKWDYDLAYSWMIGREIADPFYGAHPERFAPWHAARRVALFPHPFSSMGWKDPVVVNKRSVNKAGVPWGKITNNQSSVLSSVGFKHFVAYVLGAANIRRLNNSNATSRDAMKTDDTMAPAMATATATTHLHRTARVAHRPSSIAPANPSISTSARLKFKTAWHGGDGFAVSFSLPLEHCDFVTLHAKK